MNSPSRESSFSIASPGRERRQKTEHRPQFEAVANASQSILQTISHMTEQLASIQQQHNQFLRDHFSDSQVEHDMGVMKSVLERLHRRVVCMSAYCDYIHKRIDGPPRAGYFSVLPLDLVVMCLSPRREAMSMFHQIAPVCREWRTLHYQWATRLSIPRIMDGSKWDFLETPTISTDDLMRLVERYPSLETIDLNNTMVTDMHVACCMLPMAARVRAIDLSGCPEVRTLSSLGMCYLLRYLDVSGCARVRDLRPLGSCTRLEILAMDGTVVSDLQPLSNCPRLVALSFSNTLVVDVAPLAACTSLSFVCMSNAHVAELDAFAHTTRITELRCGGTLVSSLAPLSKCTDLRRLMIDATRVTMLEPLRACTQMELLWLGRTAVTSLQVLGGMPALSELWIEEMIGPDIRPLVHCALQSLSLNGCQVGDLSPLTHCTALRHLHLVDTHLSSVRPIAACVKLEELLLSGNPSLADVDVLSSLVSLEMLTLNHTSTDSIAALRHCTRLTWLSLCRTPVSDIRHLSSCLALEHICLTNSQVTDVSALKSCSNLQTLCLPPTVRDDPPPLDTPGLHCVDGNNDDELPAAPPTPTVCPVCPPFSSRWATAGPYQVPDW
eukprot:gnl/Spiro4/23038_TR11383_c0_g1_i1.p1 gnl/Spiro4/23038_TR11383_c0_g1~~gnl/Spiro4/23038_TR11383_c0_g1_i1.p1  ORF type:complete len:610 (+),score=79.64 gnl/Spiro4/23038_TR11383_c0_g1_i1:79-1908(+)